MSTPIDLASLDLTQLTTLRTQVDQAIDREKARRRKRALAEISRLAGEGELSAETVAAHLQKRPRRSRNPSKPRYRDPANPAHTWAGRGKRPAWLTQKLAGGATLDDFRIANPE